MSRTKLAAIKRDCWTALLVLSLLVAQFAGLQHRIEHAGWSGKFVASGGFDDTADGKKHPAHSCVALDAATLADTLGTALPAFLPLEASYALARPAIPASWTAPPERHFASRAPPAAC